MVSNVGAHLRPPSWRAFPLSLCLKYSFKLILPIIKSYYTPSANAFKVNLSFCRSGRWASHSQHSCLNFYSSEFSKISFLRFLAHEIQKAVYANAELFLNGSTFTVLSNNLVRKAHAPARIFRLVFPYMSGRQGRCVLPQP